MNEILTQSYIAKKVAMRHPEFAHAKNTMSKTEYLFWVMNKRASMFSSELLEPAKAAIMRRYRIRKHKMLYKDPTFRQWVTDVLGAYQQHDILNFFSEKTGLSAERIAAATIGDGTINIPYLQSLVEDLEQVTGKELLNNDDVFMCPLAYLDENITYAELASYFAASGNDRVELCKRKANVR
ncbi:MAG: hypothetical protein E7016_07385 [Alphaproteobacteria bacterium]|nr:hypothetical protein [Alphaproteobacteria bacterium]